MSAHRSQHIRQRHIAREEESQVIGGGATHPGRRSETTCSSSLDDERVTRLVHKAVAAHNEATVTIAVSTTSHAAGRGLGLHDGPHPNEGKKFGQGREPAASL